MWTRTMFETDFYHVISWFLIYSVLGWVVESIYMSFCEKRFVNRGFLLGPCCPIYGFGALLVYFILRPFSGNYVILYVIGCIVPTVFEFFVAAFMQMFLGKVWWDYTDKPFNFRGVICLESTIAWGFYTLFLFLFLQRGVMFLTNLVSFEIGTRVIPVVMTVACLDLLIHIMIAKKEYMPERIESVLNSIANFKLRR